MEFFLKKNPKSIPISLLILSFILIFPAVLNILSSDWNYYFYTFAVATSIISFIIIAVLLILAIIYLCTKNVTPIKKEKEEILNPTQHSVRLSAAILSIVAGSIQLVLTIISIILINDAVNLINGFGGGISGSVSDLFIALSVIDILFSLSMIILGSLFAKKNSAGISFAIMALTIVLIILDIINISSIATAFNVIMLIVHLTILALIISYICLKNVGKKEGGNERLKTTAEESTKSSPKNFNAKIEYLKKLREENVISEEEYKKLLLKYLDNI